MRKLIQGAVIFLMVSIIELYPPPLNSNQGRSYFFSLEEAAIDPRRPVLLVFFTVACHVCWDELFIWRDFIMTRGIPVQLVGVTRDPEEAVAAFLRKYAVSVRIVLDQHGLLFRQHKVRLEPFLILFQGEKIIYKDNLMEPLARRREKLEQCLLAFN